MLAGLVALVLPPTLLGMAATPSIWAMVESYPDAPTILRVLWLSSAIFGSVAMLAGTMRWRAQQSSLLRAVGASPSDRGT